MAVRRRLLFPSLSLLATIALLYLTSAWWLPAFGRALVYDEGPAPAEAAVVLAGDFTGYRVKGAADLARRGLVPVVFVSGPSDMYGINEADAAIRYIVSQGYPAEQFVPLRHTSSSTREEARAVLAELAKRQIHRIDLVTSNYHTRRARRIFLEVERERGGGPALHMVATPDPTYDPAVWWRTREGLKTAFFEWTKAITSLVGI